MAGEYDLGTARGKIVLDYDGKDSARQAEDDIDRLSRKSKDADRDFSKFGKTLGAIGKGTALSGLVVSLTNAGAQAAALGIQIAGMVPALASLASLSAALPATFAGLAVTVGTLKAAFAGFDDVVSAAFNPEGAEKFNEALKQLSPNAREFAIGLRDAVPALREVQQAIQDAFFSQNLQEFLPRLTNGLDSLLPSLQGLSSALGALSREFLRVTVDSDSTWEFLDTVINSTRDSIAQLTASIAPLITGLRDAGVVGLPLFERLGTTVADLTRRFGEWLSAVSSDGRLQSWIDTALVTLRQLGALVSNLGGIFTAIFQAAGDAGGGLLGTLAAITGEFRAFLESAEGSTAMREVFASILEVARQLAPVITTLVGALARALGPALAQIATEVGPVLLDVVNALAPAFGPLAQALADVLGAVAPLVPPLAQLVSLLVQQLSGGLSALAAELGPVIALFSGVFLQALQELTPVITSMVREALPLAAAFGTELMSALAPLAPVILEVARAFMDALVPVLPQLMDAAQQLLPVVVELAAIFATTLASGLQAIIPLIPPMVQSFAAMAGVLTGSIAAGLKLTGWIVQFGQLMFSLPGMVVGAVQTVFGAIGSGISSAWSAVSSFGGQIIGWFSALPGRVGGFLSRLPGIIGDFIVGAIQKAAFEFGAAIGRIISFAIAFPGRVADAIKALPGLVGGILTSTWNRAKALFNSGVNTVTSLARTLPGRVASATRSMISLLGSIASQAWNRLRTAFSNGVNNARSVASTLPGRIRSAVGNLGSLLVNAGRDAVMGLVRGLRGAIGAAINAAASVGRSIINGIKSTLRISSPSKVMIEFGTDTGEGLIVGLLRKIRDVRAAATDLANTVVAPTLGFDTGTLGRIGASAAVRAVAPFSRPREDSLPTEGGTRVYRVAFGDRVFADLVVDAITGRPLEVKKAGDEGSRRAAWAGSGR